MATKKLTNTVTAPAIRKYVENNIRTHGKTVATLSEPLIGRIGDLNEELKGRFTYSTLAAEILAGQPFDAEAYSSRIHEDHHRHEMLIAERDIVYKALMELRQRRDWEPRDVGDQELAYLNEQVHALAEDVRNIAAKYPDRVTIDMVRTHPELADGVSAQFTAIEAYEHIRERQLRIATSADFMGVGQRHALVVSGRLKNSLDTEAFWLDTRRGRVAEVESHQRHVLPRQQLSEARMKFFLDVPTIPWPQSTTPTTAWPDETVEPWPYLVWAATEAELWVPSLDELSEHHEDNLEAVKVVKDPTQTRTAGRTSARLYTAEGQSM